MRKLARLAAVILAAAMTVGLSSCDSGNQPAVTEETTTVTTVATTAETTVSETTTEKQTETEKETETEAEEETSFVPPEGEVPKIDDVYEKNFSVGLSVTNADLWYPEKQAVLTGYFNSMTMGNEMKPDSILDYAACSADPEKYNECPAVHFDNAKIGLDFAKENGIPMRGHTLVWHQQTPKWFFKENYSKDADAPFVSKELMLKRLENYIRQVMEYTNENYPGVIYCWDVVNEAINLGDGQENGYRTKDSMWYQVCGEEYVEKAFEYARKYAAPDVKLFYNDFNTYETPKTIAICNMVEKIKAQGNIDGIGMQSHVTLSYPSVMDYEAAVTRFGKLGLEIQVTELDMANYEQDFEKQASKYKRLFNILKTCDESGKADVTNVTIWGVSDEQSWLDNGKGQAYALLFDMYLNPKSAYYGAIGDESIPLF